MWWHFLVEENPKHRYFSQNRSLLLKSPLTLSDFWSQTVNSLLLVCSTKKFKKRRNDQYLFLMFWDLDSIPRPDVLLTLWFFIVVCRPGSIIVDLVLRFSQSINDSDVISTLKTAAEQDKFGLFTVDPDSIRITGPEPSSQSTKTTKGTEPSTKGTV